MKDNYIKSWLRDFWGIFGHELRTIFSDGGFLIIFFFAGLAYPILYNLIYKNGVLEDTPVAVVDNSGCAASRRFIREVDATREVSIAYRCVNMEEAKDLMQKRKVNGIIMFPSDFGEKIERMETAKISIYADMSSFLYYKNLLMGTEFVMLHEINSIQIERYNASGMTDQQSYQMVKAIPYEENIPYNRTFSYSIFLISAILMLIIQQVMFYGMSLLTGTSREENRSLATLPEDFSGHGMGRVVLGRGLAYWLLFMTISLYIAIIIPAWFGLPQRGSFQDIIVLLVFFLTDCVFFCQAWSSLITRRETVFVLLLFVSPILLFLTGFSWPTCAFPKFWKWFSYLFPSTFGCQAFINLNTAGGDLETIRFQLMAMTVQGMVYYALANIAVLVENWVISHREAIKGKRQEVKGKIEERIEDRIEKRTGKRISISSILDKPIDPGS